MNFIQSICKAVGKLMGIECPYNFRLHRRHSFIKGNNE